MKQRLTLKDKFTSTVSRGEVYTPFQRWLITFVEEKGIDLSDFVTAGDGSEIQVGEVISMMMIAPENEQKEIKKTLIMIDFKNGDILDFIAHLAKAINKEDIEIEF